MFPLGFILLSLGAYLADCAITNRPPIATLEQMIANPGNMREILANGRGTGYESQYQSAESLAALYSNLQAPASLGDNDKFTTGQSGDPITGLTESFSSAAPANMKAVALAKSQVGKPYRWGATGPNAYDCSGLMYWAYKHAGKTIPRTTAAMLVSSKLVKVSKANLQPGDLVFPKVGHVFMYIGNNKVVEAPHTGTNVHITNLYAFMTARRVP